MVENTLNKDRTFIKKMRVNNFRALKDVKIDLGSNLTMISGINAVGKSSILGLLAQICSFKSSYYPSDNGNGFKKVNIPDNFKTVYNQRFESEFKDHFKISKKYDTPENDYSTDFIINDAEEGLLVNAELTGTRREDVLRFVLRKKDTITSNSSRNVTLPTIYLSLRRLTPFVARKTNLVNGLFTEEEKDLFEQYNRHVFNQISNDLHISSNEDNQVDSTVITSSNYNIESASTGEDNLGQLISSLISFIRLEKNWSNYKGGLLLIDELDASLFPKAQIGLLNLFRKVASEHKIQIVFTTHSPIIISKMLEFKKDTQKNAKTKNTIGINFLNNATGVVRNQNSITMDEIIASLEVKRINKQKERKIHCYCEDTEAYTFLNGILNTKQKAKIEIMKTIKLGGENMWDLVTKGIPEFSKLSIIILDGDKEKHRKTNTINLPSPMPPDQLMFKLLEEEPADSSYWEERVWDKQLFNNSDEYIKIKDKTIFDKQKGKYILKDNINGIKTRDLFKAWFNKEKGTIAKAQFNPIKQLWVKNHSNEIKRFSSQFDDAYDFCYSHLNYLS
ncbi:hypothetical protein EFO64_02420 [Limosilactobacillus reuteri]|uniref:ATP-dependent nuclease n=1 Tax=Limosilactobacillus reuteri TaxID=1598 RepID=UPI0011802949|nr:AAA family ATPase [Limosilactobacillus reuteri]MCT3202679.1 hypothetical protein [Limosilactobacillus reuteri]MCT3212617.1 hypothetical protein [Limosilactobacillus reuteri]TSB20944.1 ATP-binding protein [Limosilactobacillus reuteri]